MEENRQGSSQQDGVFSRPFLPGVNGLPRERANRFSGENKPFRVKTERDQDCVKLEPFNYYPGVENLLQNSPLAPVVPRRRESLPDEYLSLREQRRVEFGRQNSLPLPLNLSGSCSKFEMNPEEENRQNNNIKEEMVETEILAGEGGSEGCLPGSGERVEGGSNRTVIGKHSQDHLFSTNKEQSR